VIRLWMPLFVLFLLLPAAARAGDRDVDVFASPELMDSGLMRYMLPRFSLKTGIGIHLMPLQDRAETAAGARVLLTATPPETPTRAAAPVLRKGDRLFFVMQMGDAPTSRKSTRFVDWLLSDVGQRVVERFQPDGTQLYTGAAAAAVVVEVIRFEGDIAAGEMVAYQKCARCHVIGERNRMKGIGSTPSFGVVRSIANWQDRFQTFYLRIPHPSMTQIEGLTAPFDITRPPPIFPVRLTQKEYDDMLAYVSTVAPADLGAPLQLQ
jgi:mono/diheme cytochrome c family protein